MENKSDPFMFVKADNHIDTNNYAVLVKELDAKTKKFLRKKLGAIKDKAKANLKKQKASYSHLEQSIDVKIVTKGRGSDKKLWAGVGARTTVYEETTPRGKKRIKRPSKYSHLVERGFTHLPDGKKIEGRPFLRPAVLSEGGNKKIIEELDAISKKSLEESFKNGKTK